MPKRFIPSKIPVPKLRLHGKRRRPIVPGSRPGVVEVDPEAPKPVIRVIAYGEQEIEERVIENLDELPPFLERFPVTWVDVQGLGDADVLQRLGDLFSIHPLALEDVVNVPQRPKAEAYENRLFVVLQMLRDGSDRGLEQVSLCVSERFVVSFQEAVGDSFDPVRERLRSGRQRIRGAGPDYLAYALIDAVVDHYLPALEGLLDRLESLEDRMRGRMEEPLAHIRNARGEVQALRRALLPLRDLTRSLVSGDWPALEEPTKVFLRDCYDHALVAVEQVDVCREVAAGLMDVHLSTLSHEVNQTMKVLTVIATIFMPLGFIAGLYGMNFDPEASRWNMPELSWPLGYPYALGLMAVVAALLVIYFWRKGWFE